MSFASHLYESNETRDRVKSRGTREVRGREGSRSHLWVLCFMHPTKRARWSLLLEVSMFIHPCVSKQNTAQRPTVIQYQWCVQNSFLTWQKGDNERMDVNCPRHTPYQSLIDDGSHNPERHTKNQTHCQGVWWDFTTFFAQGGTRMCCDREEGGG